MRNLLKGFKRPEKIEFKQEVEGSNYGNFIAEPFERGFGTTIGNCLRRTLMSSIEGAAITAIRIEGVTHEFSSIEGVTEDVSRIILNLKKVRLALESDDKNDIKVIQIDKKGPGVLFARDLGVDHSIQILNGDHHIATLNENASIKMHCQLERGKGYVPSELLKKNIVEIGTIPIDAIFSPVTKVNFHVEETRVAQRTDYEKLVLEVWTDGSLSAEDAVGQAAKILKEHFTVFINFEEEPYIESEDKNEMEEMLSQNLERHIEDLDLTVRSLSLLKSLDIEYVADLVKKLEEELKKSDHYSVLCAEEIRHKLAQMNLEFGMRDIGAVAQDLPQNLVVN